jgi:2-oxoglutarate ferredoxin oxidoreductase subunit beta
MAVIKKHPKLLPLPTLLPWLRHGIVVPYSRGLEELGYDDKVLLSNGVGCSCIINTTLAVDILQCAHGRAAASATGMKRVMPDKVVFAYQGDGDAYNIGLGETMNAAYRNEKITVFVVNNGNFGMTGGQMSWTTLEGQKTATSINGRDIVRTGAPIHIPEMLASGFAPAFVARGSVYAASRINKLKGYIKNALEAQINGEGYSLVEIRSPCPTNWGLDPVKAMERVKTEMEAIYPLGILKDRIKGGGKQ